ncbi:uncharacterized protein LOC120902922 isoform X1 [Anopheles arabiensis]|uniref:Ig-like domain-containing protein n=2 Tax=gambiae species complex TaxID=44542 RepID=A0A1S4GYX2_ANOGA|nr:uncharacterized protein LOC120902922 isoform X1 [Anopheles arabiensis]XP_040167941.1 uncharacterized protein LOC120902922 isoform X1 [Anopheles arabiensis]XP_040167942.1 uncharacterized protein LOC120902922 isoform X1 [Anopheles arabiensis]XP_040167943.1 uncharacterized protein LOC120902922 isoform X1 [Anopheles arabiensis]XP_040167944.1 uncharacterized protein LOC120902922 isoform X1 [Anopheles arabiensis]XP_040167945.1 uncharacterized protein LOC120902922 isoform X1 [Anopheles arabiensis]
MDCKRILRCSALVVLVLVTLVNAQSSGAHKRDLNNLYQVIYYGDSQVEVGKPFSISCIISIANPVEWHKDGEPIRKHSNIRHGKDEHSYIESEMGIAGNRDKIEASISVQRALPKHQGRYQCNALYKNYHQLYVYRNGTLLGHGAGAAAVAVPGPSRGRDEMQVLLSTVKSTLVAPLQQPIEHHHFTTAVALAPGPPIVDEELPREHERDRESPKGGHSPHHHRQQAGQGHRHHTASGGLAGEKQPDHSSPAMGKDDSKRFVSQKTTTIDQNGLLEQTRVEDLDRDFAPVLHNTDHRGASPMMGKGSKKQHSSAGRVHVPVETREEDEDEQEEIIGGGDVAETREGLDLDTTGTDADHAEDLVEPDTEIVIESKAISLEDENIDRLIQNKSDINGIILVDSLEELATLRKQPSSALLPILPTREAMTSNGSSGFSLAVSTVGPMLTGAVSKDGGSVVLLTSVAPPLEQDNTVHHNHHHHHHEHHGSSSSSSSTAAKMATTLTATTSTTTTTASTTTITTTTTTSTTTTTAAPPTTTTIAAADVLLPNYDQASTSLKIFDIAKALTLGCNITQEGNFELSWAKDGKNVSEVESLKDRFKILAAERKFVISRALETDAGQYTCSVPQLGVSKSFNVVANVVVKFESTEIGKTNIVEGERLTLHCIAYGTDPKITWTVGNNTYNASTDHIVLEEDERGVENAKLIIDSIKLDDYADYTCEARNNATEFTGKPAQVLITVRVRGKYAALYVFLGIIVEVVLLCAIILICEKRRNKTEIEESDTDQSPDQNKNGYHGNESELRQRK